MRSYHNVAHDHHIALRLERVRYTLAWIVRCLSIAVLVLAWSLPVIANLLGGPRIALLIVALFATAVIIPLWLPVERLLREWRTTSYSKEQNDATPERGE